MLNQSSFRRNTTTMQLVIHDPMGMFFIALCSLGNSKNEGGTAKFISAAN